MNVANTAESQTCAKFLVVSLTVGTHEHTDSHVFSNVSGKNENPKLPDLSAHRIFNCLILASVFFRQIVTLQFSFLIFYGIVFWFWISQGSADF